MRARAAFRLGQAIGLVVAIVIVIAYAMLGDVLRLTADQEQDDVLLWLYANDAAPGQHLQGRAWIDAPDDVWIAGVNVNADGDKIGIDDCTGDCKSHTVDFDFTVPADAHDSVMVDFDVVPRPNQDRRHFGQEIPLYSHGMSALRRIGKAGLALALLVAQAALLFLLGRRALRRGKDRSPLWLVPVAAIGLVVFVPLLIDALRLHGVWLDAVAVGAWTAAAFAIADRLNLRVGLQPYVANQLLVDVPASDPFRGAAAVAPIKPVEDVENAWLAVGLLVRRVGGALVITAPGKQIAVVPVPRSESFGGEPLAFRASHSELAELLVATASNVLGEMRLP
jgi:hypothetical protein